MGRHTLRRLLKLLTDKGWLAGLALLWAFSGFTAQAQEKYLSPGRNLEVFGAPPVPASLAGAVQPYLNIYGLPLAGWHPTRRELRLKGLSSVAWVSLVSAPGAEPETTTTYLQESGIYDLYWQLQDRYLVYVKDDAGNEVFQLYLYNINRCQSVQLTDGKTRNTEPIWSHAGEQLVYSSSPAGGLGVSLRVINPFEPASDRLLAQSAGGYFKAYDWSPDDRQIVYCDFAANTASTLWLADVKTGEKTLLSPTAATPELYEAPQFSRNGKGLYVITDHEADVRRLAYVDFQTKRFSYLTTDLKWDVEEFQLAPDGQTVAFVVNENGLSRLYLLNPANGKISPVPQLPAGLISDLKWHSNSVDLAFNVRTPQTPNDVYALNAKTNTVEVWAHSATNGFDTKQLVTPQPVCWPAADKRPINGFLYRPPATFKGPRPVIIDLHGGPEEQFRPGFGYEDNYFLNELGVAKIYPNVRGSSGYGKAFLALDNGLSREDAVKDVGALLDWIKTQPDLDANRVLVQGVSYGGYLALMTAAAYSERLRGAVSDSGITNLASFVERTEGWRRGLQRSEFGDERIPAVRAFMERTAPLNNAAKIKTPLLLIQGQNDPRVPVTEANALFQATKGRIPVWYLRARDEGHGFVNPENRNYRLYALIRFVQEYLLPTTINPSPTLQPRSSTAGNSGGKQ